MLYSHYMFLPGTGHLQVSIHIYRVTRYGTAWGVFICSSACVCSREQWAVTVNRFTETDGTIKMSPCPRNTFYSD
jgi:hypothetical protein